VRRDRAARVVDARCRTRCRAIAEHVDIEAKVASGLRHLGFRDADVPAVLAQLRQEAGGSHTPADGAPPVMTTERLLRAALARLVPTRSARH
jgi:hypothetical protein